MAGLIDELDALVEKADALISHIKKHIFSPHGEKQYNRLFKISDAAQLINRHQNSIRNAEKEGLIESERINDRNRGFNLKQINQARRHFGTEPRLGLNEDAAVIAVQNFKGGVGKSTIAVHLAQWAAIRGFRTLLIDLDSQASSTSLFGYTPDLDIDQDDTLLPYFMGEQRTMHYAIRDTHIENLSLIPANLQLYGAEYVIASQRDEQPIYSYLPRGIQDLKQDYEIIIIDPPPALGMFSINTLVAADCLLIPMPPRMLDFTSSLQFFNMLRETMGSIQEHMGTELDYNFIKIVTSKKKQRLSDEKYAKAEDDIFDLAKDIFGDKYMLNNVIYESSAIDNAANEFKTLFEVEGATTGYKSYRTALKGMEAVFEEVFDELLLHWPSIQKKLKQQKKPVAQ